MRRNLAFVLGTVTGACLTLLVAGPHGAVVVAGAKAAARPETYSQLNLFGTVFERVKASYVEKPDDSKLMEGAINGMIVGSVIAGLNNPDLNQRQLAEAMRRVMYDGISVRPAH